MPSAISKPEKCIWIRQLLRQRKFIEEINFESVHADSCISISCSSYSDKGVESPSDSVCTQAMETAPNSLQRNLWLQLVNSRGYGKMGR